LVYANVAPIVPSDGCCRILTENEHTDRLGKTFFHFRASALRCLDANTQALESERLRVCVKTS